MSSKCRCWECETVPFTGNKFCDFHSKLEGWEKNYMDKRSNCHGAKLITNIEAQGRRLPDGWVGSIYYICTECKEPCDIKEAEGG